MKRCLVVFICSLFINISVQAGEQCIERYECVNTCDWQDGNPNSPVVILRYYLSNGIGWTNPPNSDASPGIDCDKAYSLYNPGRKKCSNYAESISYDCNGDCGSPNTNCCWPKELPSCPNCDMNNVTPPCCDIVCSGNLERRRLEEKEKKKPE